MSESIMLALITASAAVAGGIVAGTFSYIAVAQQRKWEQNVRRLAKAYSDICALCRIEELYSEMLATTEGKSALAIKKATRAQLREGGHDSPSEDATILHCERHIKELV